MTSAPAAPPFVRDARLPSPALGYIIYFRLLTGAGGGVTSQTSMTITLCGLFYGWLIFAEVPGWLTIPAVGLIFGGLLLVTLSPPAPSAPPRRRTASPSPH